MRQMLACLIALTLVSYSFGQESIQYSPTLNANSQPGDYFIVSQPENSSPVTIQHSGLAHPTTSSATQALPAGQIFDGSNTQSAVPQSVSAAERSQPLTDSEHQTHSYQRQHHDPLHHDSHTSPDSKFPRSWLLPNTQTRIQIGGYAKLDVIYDVNEIGNRFAFQTTSIPTTSDTGGRTTIHARQSRFFLETQTPTEALGDIKTYIETDFFGSGNTLRLRHAYAETKRLLVGQTWTSFMDIAAHPRTLDFEGPPGMAFRRQAQVRYKIPFSKQLLFALSLENPDSAVGFPGGGANLNRSPDFVAHSIFKSQRGHMQMAALVRDIGFRADAGPTAGLSQNETGYGFSISGSLKTIGKNNIRGQYAHGKGIGDYFLDLNGGGVLADGAADLAGNLQLLDVSGWFVALEHWWNLKLRSNFVYGNGRLDNIAGQAGTAFSNSEYVAVNLISSPIKSVDIGVEYLYGTQADFANNQGEANRLRFSTIWRF